MEVVSAFQGPCRANPPQIYRVLQNLVQNAVEAVDENGRIRITAEEVSEDAVGIRIEDSGPGVPEEIRERLFEPFASFNKSGGTGLGLAVVKKIVEEHGGRVWEERRDLKGACFHLTLPKER